MPARPTYKIALIQPVCMCQAASNEVVAASVMCLPAARLDRPMAAGRSAALRHFSVVRKLDGLPFPAGGWNTHPLQNQHSLRYGRVILPYSTLLWCCCSLKGVEMGRA